MAKLVKTEFIRMRRPPTDICFTFQLLILFFKLILYDPPICMAKLSKMHWNARYLKDTSQIDNQIIVSTVVPTL